MTLLSTTTMVGSSQINLTSINQTYKDLVVLINQAKNDTADSNILVIINATASSGFQIGSFNSSSLTSISDEPIKPTNATNVDRTFAQTHCIILKNYASSTAFKPFEFFGTAYPSGVGAYRGTFGAGGQKDTTAITSLRFQTSPAYNFNAGEILLYGVN
jgi:hypothetical protein